MNVVVFSTDRQQTEKVVSKIHRLEEASSMGKVKSLGEACLEADSIESRLKTLMETNEETKAQVRY